MHNLPTRWHVLVTLHPPALDPQVDQAQEDRHGVTVITFLPPRRAAVTERPAIAAWRTPASSSRTSGRIR